MNVTTIPPEFGGFFFETLLFELGFGTLVQ